MHHMRPTSSNWLCLVALLAPLSLSAGEKKNASVPGKVFAEIPTIHCLGVRWPVVGDANKNAVIEVRYRKAGAAEWKLGYPLFRTYPDPHRDNPTPFVRVKGGWMFAGSIVDLKPSTEYEVKLNLKDPDGGDAERSLKMKTWQEPMQPPGMRVRHVVPGNGGGCGTPDDPLKGLTAANDSAEPGDLFLLHKGTYIKDVCKDNTWVLDNFGEPGKPIIYRAAGDGEVILDGGGTRKNERLVCAEASRHIWFEGLTLKGKAYLIVAHWGSHWVLRRCTFHCTLGKAFEAHNGGYKASQRHFISDNVFTGPTHWPRKKGIESFAGTNMTGAGHVVCYNLFTHLGDGVHGKSNAETSANDFYNNEFNICTDDGIETDWSDLNMRVFDNRIVNVIHAITFQPVRGGPSYAFRNVIYNATYTPFKLHNQTSGLLLFHNTCIRNGNPFKIVNAGEIVTNAWSRNNLYIGTGGAGMMSVGRMRHCNFDNDGYGGWKGPFIGAWNKQRWNTMEDAKKAGVIYAGKGAHKVDPAGLFASGLLAPAAPNTKYKSEDIDVRLKEGSDAIDKGVVLPGFNDGFTGKAPDLGAFEFGDKLPHYGPRPKKDTPPPPVKQMVKPPAGSVAKRTAKRPKMVADVEKGPYKTRVIKEVEKLPTIKGKTWQEASKGLTEFKFGVLEMGRGNSMTAVRAFMAYTKNDLYMLFVNAEPKTIMMVTNFTDRKNHHDGGLWQDDCMELFFCTDPETNRKAYCQLMVNSAGVVYDAKVVSGKTKDKAWSTEAKVESRVIESGGAAKPGAWMVEMAIPWKNMGGYPKPGTSWYINMARDRMVGENQEYSWAPISGSYHQPMKFRQIVFGKGGEQ